jgi:hypothetical protein
MKECSICSGPPESRAAVDSMLRQKLSMKKIEAVSPYSRATIGRHSLKCLARHTVEKHKQLKFQKPIVLWPEGTAHILFNHERQLSPAEVNSLCASGDYCVWQIEYSALSDEAAQNIANLEARQQEIRNRVAAPEENKVDVVNFHSDPEDISFTRAEPEIPIQQKPESPAQGMRDLLADVQRMIRGGRRCG